jgi:hypothetical protein
LLNLIGSSYFSESNAKFQKILKKRGEEQGASLNKEEGAAIMAIASMWKKKKKAI